MPVIQSLIVSRLLSKLRLPQASAYVYTLIVITGSAHAQALETKAPDATVVTVTAERPPVAHRLDRQVYRTDKNIQATTGSAADVLNSIPSVAVDPDGNVTLRGDSQVIILIDGKPATQFAGATGGDGLQQMAGSDIQQVEVMTNPPAEYGAEGTGVINIVTRKGRASGASGTLSANAGDKQRYILGSSGSANFGKLTVSGGLGLRQDEKLRRIFDSRRVELPGQPVALSTQSLEEHQRRLNPSISGSMDYKMDDHDAAGATFSHSERKGIRFFDQLDVAIDDNDTPLKRSDRYSNGRDWRLDAAQGAHLDHSLASPGETISFTVQRSVTREREHYDYLNTYTLPVAPDSRDDLNLSLDLITTELGVDYILPLGDSHQFKMGYRFHRDDNAYDNRGDTIDSLSGVLLPDPNITNHFRYRQAIQAGYMSLQTSVTGWDVLTGLRVEQTDVRTLQITGNVANSRRYMRAYPSLRLEKTLSDTNSLSLGFSRRVSRPDPEDLNPFSDHQDIHNLRAGNPDLRPQDIEAFEISYQGKHQGTSYALTGYARFNRNAVTDTLAAQGPDVVLATKINLPKSNAFGSEFSLNGRLTPQITYAASGNLFYNQIDVASLGLGGLRSTTGLNLKSSLDYHPAPTDTVQISLNRADKRLTAQGNISATNIVNLGYRHQISPKATLIMTISDLLNGQKTVRTIATRTLYDRYQRQQVGQLAYIGLSLSLGSAKKAKPSGFDYEQ